MKSSNSIKVSYSVWILSGLMFGVFGGRAGISRAAEDTWTYMADMSGVRSFSGGGVVDGKIYVIGGAPSNSNLIPAVEMYDPIVDTWAKMADMPSARGAHATCTLDGKIYVFGGNSPDVWSTGKKNVYIYDPQIDCWTQKSDMPYANAMCGIAVVDGIIYLMGGMLTPSSSPIATVMAYDPITESWTQKANMPTARGGLSACAVDGKIYAIGGTTANWRVSSYKHVEVYDPSTDTWDRKSDMSTERWGLGTCAVDGKIYAIGGWSGSDACTANEAYDPITDTWTTKSPMQQKRNGAFVCSIGDRIYAIGGAYAVPSPGFLSTAEEYDTGLGASSNKAISRRDFEEALNQGKLEVYDEIIAPEAILHTVSGDIIGLEAIRGFAGMIITAFPDIYFTIEDMVAEGDLVGIRWTNTGTQQGEYMGIPATGISTEGTGMAFHRIADSKIQELWLFVDDLGMLEQLGLMPPTREDYTWGTSSTVTGDPDNPVTNTALVLYVVQKFWNEQNIDALDMTHSPDAIAYNPVIPGSPLDFDGYKQAALMHLVAFPDFRVTTENIIAEGDKVAIRWTVNGTHLGELMGIPPTERPVKFTGVTIYRFADDKIIESWWSYDALGMMQQITALPESDTGQQ